VQRQPMAQAIHRQVPLAAFASCGPIMPGAFATFGRGLHGPRLSKMAAEGCPFRPSAKRSSARRSCTIASNTPAFSHRCAC
jgi:hypothetical protein